MSSSNLLRFYGEVKDGYIVPLKGQKVEEVLENINIPVTEETSNYYEVKLPVDGSKVLITSLDVDYIKPEAIHAARTYNETVFNELLEEEKEDNKFVDKFYLQEIIDRILTFKDEFKQELDSLLKNFPLEVEEVTSELGTTRKIKVELNETSN